MISSYKRLGDYIQEVNIRNKDLKQYPLLGVSIRKEMMTSIANIVGTDMSTYKIIKKNQFAYGPVTSRNGDKISIALSSDEKALLSQAYVVFETNNLLLPEYLMMWFRRPEFDRYARYKSHGSAREIFDWQEMSEVMLPIPSVEKQQEMVNEYHTIQNRINLNNQLIAKLEETAKTIYKQWFVDFEFPDENGKPYKSNGGKMIWCEELEKEIPEGWEVGKIGNEYDLTIGRTPPRIEKKWFNKNKYSINWISIRDLASCQTYIFDTNENLTLEAIKKFSIPIIKENTTIMSFKMSIGKLAITTKEMLSNEAIVHFNCNDKTKLSSEFIYCFLYQFKFNTLGSTSSIVESINTQIIKNIDFLLPTKAILILFDKIIKPLFNNKKDIEMQTQKLEELKELLLGRMVRG